MAQNTLAVSLESSEKEKPRGKTYRIPVSTGIFEHCSKIKDALWLFLWYIDKTTTSGTEGTVLGGSPITDEEPASILGVKKKTARRWRRMLTSGGYINALRTPYGYVITVSKSKKWAWQSVRESARAGNSELPLRAVRLPAMGTETSRQGKNKEDRTVDITEDRTVEAEDATASANFPTKEKSRKILKEAWDRIGMEPTGSIRFCVAWERAYADASDDDTLVDIMERAIQHCQASGIRVPPPFYDAKRRIEKEDSDRKSDESDKVAGLPMLRPHY